MFCYIIFHTVVKKYTPHLVQNNISKTALHVKRLYVRVTLFIIIL